MKSNRFFQTKLRPVLASSLPLLLLLAIGSIAGCGQKPASIRVSPPKTTIYGLKKRTVATAEVLDSKGRAINGAVVTWESAKPGVATVDNDGRIQSIAPGKTILNVKLNGLSGAGLVEVVDTATITVSPMRVALPGPKGSTLQLKSVVKDSKSHELEVRPKWSSSDAKIANVNPDGVVTSVSEGRVVINATIGDIGSGTDLRVTFKKVATFEAGPPTMILKIGDVQQVNGFARDEAGVVIADAPIDWVSSDPKTVSCTHGEAKGLAAGTASIRATCSGKTAEVSVLVN